MSKRYDLPQMGIRETITTLNDVKDVLANRYEEIDKFTQEGTTRRNQLAAVDNAISHLYNIDRLLEIVKSLSA